MLILGLISAVPSGLVFLLELRSRTESPQAPWPSVGREERPWGTIKSSFFYWLSFQWLVLFYGRNPAVIKFQFLRVSPGDRLLAKERQRTLDTRLSEKRHERGLIFQTAAGNRPYVNAVNIVDSKQGSEGIK